jgi:predicted  nucleic acid-binding Zn-ribbon protein
MIAAEVKQEMSNHSLLEKISIEFVLGLIAMLVTIGVTWGTLSSRVNAMESDLDEIARGEESLRDVQQEVKKEVGFLRTDLEVVKNNQVHLREKIDDIDKSLDQILAELRARP